MRRASPTGYAHPLHADARLTTDVAAAQDPNTESGRECMDGLDNDGDGTMDCADSDCAAMRQCANGGAPSPPGGGTRPGQTPDDPNTESGRECMDGLDNAKRRSSDGCCVM